MHNGSESPALMIRRLLSLYLHPGTDIKV